MRFSQCIFRRPKPRHLWDAQEKEGPWRHDKFDEINSATDTVGERASPRRRGGRGAGKGARGGAANGGVRGAKDVTDKLAQVALEAPLAQSEVQAFPNSGVNTALPYARRGRSRGGGPRRGERGPLLPAAVLSTASNTIGSPTVLAPPSSAPQASDTDASSATPAKTVELSPVSPLAPTVPAADTSSPLTSNGPRPNADVAPATTASTSLTTSSVPAPAPTPATVLSPPTAQAHYGPSHAVNSSTAVRPASPSAARGLFPPPTFAPSYRPIGVSSHYPSYPVNNALSSTQGGLRSYGPPFRPHAPGPHVSSSRIESSIISALDGQHAS